MCAVPVVLVTTVIGWSNFQSSKQALEEQARDQLIAVREAKKTQIESYFDTVAKQVQTFSEDFMITYAMSSFKGKFHGIAKKLPSEDIQKMRSELGDYYTNEFASEYQQHNEQAIDIQALLKGLSSDSVYQQYRYIKSNPAPLGKKDEMVVPEKILAYDKVHRNFHTIIRSYLEKFSYEDIFLVDHKTGHIVYSVFKKLDFGTSLIDGPYANTGIGQAFAKANKLKGKDEFALADFSTYVPSYSDPASFIASPIFDGNKKLGILIFQMPVDRINDVMTYSHAWREVGLGDSGETYIIGADHKMRSIARYFSEDQPAYISALENINTDSHSLNLMKMKGTTIGYQAVETAGVNKALSGEVGFDIYAGYLGKNVLSAYAPLNIPGLDWVILSEIEADEAFAPVIKISQQMISYAAGMMLIIILAASTVAIYLSGMFTRPIVKMLQPIEELVREMEDGKGDFTKRIDVHSKDELGTLSNGINMLIEKAQTLIRDVKGAAVDVSKSTNQLAEFSSQTSQDMYAQQGETQQVTTAMNEMTVTVQEVANNAAGASESTTEADKAAKEGAKVIMQAIDAFDALASEFEGATEVIHALEKDSENIGSVLSVIRGIAEQTNLLALNAAIEAAPCWGTGSWFCCGCR